MNWYYWIGLAWSLYVIVCVIWILTKNDFRKSTIHIDERPIRYYRWIKKGQK